MIPGGGRKRLGQGVEWRRVLKGEITVDTQLRLNEVGSGFPGAVSSKPCRAVQVWKPQRGEPRAGEQQAWCFSGGFILEAGTTGHRTLLGGPWRT